MRKLLNTSLRWSLTLFVALVLTLQSAGASLALCKLGIEESGCCGAHATTVTPSCCSSGAEAPENSTEGISERDCTCQLFGALPSLSSEITTESVQRLLELEQSINSIAYLIRAGEAPANLRGVRSRPPSMEPPSSSSTTRRAKLESWRL